MGTIVFPQEALVEIYNSFGIAPFLQYCWTVWSCSAYINKLFKLQKKNVLDAV